MTDTIIVILYIFIAIVLYIPLKKLYLYINNCKKENYLISDRNVLFFCITFWPITLPILIVVGITEWNDNNKDKPARW